MSMDRLMTEVIASGKWKQCAFCKRAMPTQEWRAEVIGKGDATQRMIDDEYILPSGYCTNCEQFKGSALDR